VFGGVCGETQTEVKCVVKILVISDLHVGSEYALMPNKWKNITPLDDQKQILKKWNEMCKNEKHNDYLIINGDVTDGTQSMNEGKELCISDTSEQVDAAIDLVKQIDYDKLLVTYGTFYHTKENPNLDQQFAKQIDANSHGYEINFQPKGTKDIMHLSHQISVSTSSWQYRTTPLAKELVAALLNEKELYKYKSIIRSHAHYYCYVAFSKSFGLITPCWQTRTPYMIRKGLSLIPKMGYVTITIEDDGGWDVVPHTFDLPRPKLVII